MTDMTELLPTPALKSAIASLVASKVHDARTRGGPQMGRKGRPTSMDARLPPAFWLGPRGKAMSSSGAVAKLKRQQVIMMGQTFSMAELMAQARAERGLTSVVILSRLRKGWTIEDALFAFEPEASRKPKAKRSPTPKPNPELDDLFIKRDHRSGVNHVSRQFTGRRQLAKLVPQINGELERCKPSKPCMNSSCRKCYGLQLDEEQSWTTHPKNQAGAAIADAMTEYDNSELHFVTVMDSHVPLEFDPHAKTAEFQSRMDAALLGSDVTASGMMEIQPSLKSNSVGFDFHHHGVMGTRMTRDELRRKLQKMWPEPGQVVIKDVDPEKGGCEGIASYACKERVLIPPDVADVESASGLALQMMMIWQSWGVEDRHIHVGCDRMNMSPVLPYEGHRSAHGSVPPCGGWFMNRADADLYWAKYEEVGEIDYELFLSASDDTSNDASCDVFDEGIINETRGFSSVDDSIGPAPFFWAVMGPSRQASGVMNPSGFPGIGKGGKSAALGSHSPR